jgi:hypothetical protein
VPSLATPAASGGHSPPWAARAWLLTVPASCGKRYVRTVPGTLPLSPGTFSFALFRALPRDLNLTLRHVLGQLGEEDFAALGQKREALSHQEQQRLTEQLRKVVPYAVGGSATGES